MVHCHTVHLPLGALLTWCTVWRTGIRTLQTIGGLKRQLLELLNDCGFIPSQV